LPLPLAACLLPEIFVYLSFAQAAADGWPGLKIMGLPGFDSIDL